MEQVTVDDKTLEYAPYPGFQKSELFVFVGEKISITYVPQKPGEQRFDSEFIATYKILEPVYGEFDGRFVEFRVFDHYGIPRFAAFENVLLFIRKWGDDLHHVKFLFYDVYKTTDGKWASCRAPVPGSEHARTNEPKPLTFREPVIFEINDPSRPFDENFFYPPYFEFEDGKAICKMGVYVSEVSYLIVTDLIETGRISGQ
ncbi:MAG: hypothetical protein AB7Q37_05525 [Pyrinomonadaceae bacterium]